MVPLRNGYRLWLGLCVLLTAVSAAAGALIDPTRPAGQDRPAPARAHEPRHGWILESTLVAPDRRVAVINGKRVSEGESVNGARVIAIRRLDVLIQAAGRRMTLHLLPDIVQQQP